MSYQAYNIKTREYHTNFRALPGGVVETLFETQDGSAMEWRHNPDVKLVFHDEGFTKRFIVGFILAAIINFALVSTIITLSDNQWLLFGVGIIAFVFLVNVSIMLHRKM